jgi:hypothetical protein
MTQTVVANKPVAEMMPARRAAAALGIPEYAVRGWIKRGLVKSVPCGKKRLVNVTALRQQLESGDGEIWQ